ncbi:MAG TPA: hypothetical protein PLF40_04575 [Kofleriaceae bacterium]|nr:hypothetical protein [Kofleriaceae bacterium]
MKLYTIQRGAVCLGLVCASAGCELVFGDGTDAGTSGVDALSTDRPDAALCANPQTITAALNQDTYLSDTLNMNFDRQPMHVNGASTVALLEFKLNIASGVLAKKPTFQSVELTVPVVPATVCSEPASCNDVCEQSKGTVQLDLLNDSDWDEKEATWALRYAGVRWSSPGAARAPDNLGTLATAQSVISSGLITFAVDPSQSAKIWSAVSGDNELSLRISADAGTFFAFADKDEQVCGKPVTAPNLKLTYCP